MKVTAQTTLAQRAQAIREASENPFGAMTQDEALVLLNGLNTQNIEDLMLIRDAYPAVWENHKTKSKAGKWVFERETYRALKELATGTVTDTTSSRAL